MRRRDAILVCFAAGLATQAEARRLAEGPLRSAPGFSWITVRAPHFDLYYEAKTAAERDIEKIQNRLEASWTGIEKLLGAAVDKRLAAFIVDSRARMKQLSGTESNGLASDSVSLMVYSDTINGVGAHELCHVMARWVWGGSQGSWVNEGLAVYADDQWWRLPLHSVARGLLDRDQLVPIPKLVSGGWSKKYPDPITYPELGSFIKFVYEKYGRDAVKALWQRGAGAAPKVFGKPLSEVELEWRAEVATHTPKSADYKKR